VAETRWYLKNSGDMHLNISQGESVAFGFSEWNTAAKPIYDEFELYVWETRKAAGFDEPMPEPIAYEMNKSGQVGNSFVGQILFSGQITVKAPKKHAQIYGITS
jgi:hypothetical protein